MKKLKIAVLTLLLAVSGAKNLNAQVFEEGANNISLGYGIGTVVGSLANTYEVYNEYKFTGTGPIYAKFEHGLSDKVGLGFNVAYAGYSFKYVDTYSEYNSTTGLYEDKKYSYETKYTTMSFLARLNLHFGEFDKFDPYWGVGLGYRTGKWTTTTNYTGISNFTYSNVVPFGFETTIGARYYFSDNFGIYAEMGAAKSWLQFGLNIKF